MQRLKFKFILLSLGFLFIMFFSNDFGLVDVKKTAIITALAIDINEDGSYCTTAQIAVPKTTDKNSESNKTQISGNGDTIGGAIKNIGNVSGWYPQLSFCNLILVGQEVVKNNVIPLLDYFAKSLRIQDSALLVLSETTGKKLLNSVSPLDDISSFAIQKIILKNPGFDKDAVRMDVKTFAMDYYAMSQSSIMPQIKTIKNEQEQNSETNQANSNSSNGQNSNAQNNVTFDAGTTALFFKGVKVGELNNSQTLAFNIISDNYEGSTLNITNVPSLYEEHNYLLTIIKNQPKLQIEADTNGILLKVSLDIYCKISDENTTSSDSSFIKNLPLPLSVKEKTENYLKEKITEIIELSKSTKCDFLKIKEKLYRYHRNEYSSHKDNLLESLNYTINVNVSGQQ